MKNIMITGGAGFIGGNFCHYVVETYPNDEFVCIDALTHALEAYASIMATEYRDGLALKAMKNILDSFLAIVLSSTKYFRCAGT